jgi:hypothetical protein
MSKVQDMRRANLKKLVDDYGAAALAKLLGYTRAYLYQLLYAPGAKGYRPITEKTREKIEEKLGLPPMWLDTKPGEPPPFRADVAELFALVLRAVADIMAELKIEVAPAKYPELVRMAYDQSAKIGRVDLEHIRRLIRLLK